MGDLIFPEGFLWGTATAGHQVEGGNEASNWWAWEQLGRVNDGTTSGRAVDYWHRYRADHDLMVELGHGGFRLGLEWARIEPTPGRFDEDAIAHYVDVLADLRSHGLAVCLTLNHWVIPAWFASIGAWRCDTAVAQWRRFVDVVVPAVAPYVDLWITLNEPMVPVIAGHLAGYHPPQVRNPLAAATVFRTLLHAHAVAYERIHSLVPSAPDGGPTMVGTAGAVQFVEPFHAGGAQATVERVVGRVVRQVSYQAWDESIATGRVAWPFGWAGRRSGSEVPGLRGSLDFAGVNYYTRLSVRLPPGSLSNVMAGEFDAPDGVETTDMGWQVHPPGFHAVLVESYERFGVPIYVTENGCAAHDDDPTGGDAQRRRYLLTHLDQVHRAIGDGVDVRGYLHWSFTDNFEWREGFEKRFGLVRVDHDDPELRRRPRESAYLYRDIIAANGITPAIVDRWSPGLVLPER